MGQQTNKIQKRRRRLAYIERMKVKAHTASVSKPLKKKVPAKKKAAAMASEVGPIQNLIRDVSDTHRVPPPPPKP